MMTEYSLKAECRDAILQLVNQLEEIKEKHVLTKFK